MTEDCLICGTPIDRSKTDVCSECGHNAADAECQCSGCWLDEMDASYRAELAFVDGGAL